MIFFIPLLRNNNSITSVKYCLLLGRFINIKYYFFFITNSDTHFFTCIHGKDLPLQFPGCHPSRNKWQRAVLAQARSVINRRQHFMPSHDIFIVFCKYWSISLFVIFNRRAWKLKFYFFYYLYIIVPTILLTDCEWRA